MPDEIVRQYLFDRPGLYQIRVVGELDERWIAHLEGLEISTTAWGHYPSGDTDQWMAYRSNRAIRVAGPAERSGQGDSDRGAL